MTERQKEFLQKLKSLLSEYNMSIGCNMDGDIHGVDTSIYIDDNSIKRFGDREFFSLPYTSELSAGDIKV